MEATETERAMLSSLIKQSGLTIECSKGAPKNPQMPDTHVGWTCKIFYSGKGWANGPSMDVPFYQSEYAYGTKPRYFDYPYQEREWERKNKRPAPTLEDVLSCLVMDASGYENSRNFEDWASDYGFDTDSRTAERTYQTVAEQSKALRHLLGHKRYAEYMNAENDY